MITVGWATDAIVWVDDKRECIQVLCILVEQKHHPEVRRIFLCLKADSTGVFQQLTGYQWCQ